MADNEGLYYFLYDNTFGFFNVSYRTKDNNFSDYDYKDYVLPELSNFTTDDFCEEYFYMYTNVTCDFPINYAEVMYGYIAPFLVVVTAVANTLIVAVLTRPHMRTPTNVLLMAIAFSDLLAMLFPAPWQFYLYTLGNHYKPLGPAAVCTAWYYMNDVISTMFHTASIWLTLALAVQRYIYVCHAPLARTWCTMRRVGQYVTCIGLAAFLYQLPRILDREYISRKTVWRGHVEEVCQSQLAPWAFHSYFITFEVFSVFFVYLIPCISLVVFNALLIRAMRSAQLNRQKLFRENRKSEANRLRDTNSTTLMLIVVITIFLLPLITVTTVAMLHIDAIVQRSDYQRMTYIIYQIIKFAIIFSYPVNFAICCCMSRQFREKFKGLFIRNAVTN